MNRITLFLAMILMAGNIFAQGGKIQFENTTYDFGDNIKEELGEVNGKFIFTNVGTGDLQITSVRPGCGCTSSDYTKTIVKPGEKGYVLATYHTTNRVGFFHKNITVTVNDVENPTITLYIKGTVIAKPKSKGDYYPTSIGNLKLMSNNLSLGEVKNNQIRTDTMKIYNQWDADMTLSFKDVPAHIQVNAVPLTLKKDEEGYIVITYSAALKNEYGMVSDMITIVTNDPAGPNKVLHITANLVEDFSVLSEKEKANAPKIKFEEVVYDFGKVKSGTIVKLNFNFTNEGKSKLIIRRIKPECGCTTTELEKKVYKKGQKGSIQVSYDTNGRRGDDKKYIQIISNDPSQPNIQLVIQGVVY